MNEKIVTTNEIMDSVNALQLSMNDFRSSISENQSSLQDLMGFLQEHMVVKEELEEAKQELRREMTVQRIHLLDILDTKFLELKQSFNELKKCFVNLVTVLQKKSVLTFQEAKAVLPSERLS